MKIPRTPRILAHSPLPAPARERPPPVRSASRLRRNAADGQPPPHHPPTAAAGRRNARNSPRRDDSHARSSCNKPSRRPVPEPARRKNGSTDSPR